jgi:hypothetical protein
MNCPCIAPIWQIRRSHKHNTIVQEIVEQLINLIAICPTKLHCAVAKVGKGMNHPQNDDGFGQQFIKVTLQNAKEICAKKREFSFDGIIRTAVLGHFGWPPLFPAPLAPLSNSLKFLQD